MPENFSQRPKSARRKRAMPVVIWLQAGAAMAAAGIALSAAPTASADDGGTTATSHSASTAVRGGAQRSATTGHRNPQAPPAAASRAPKYAAQPVPTLNRPSAAATVRARTSAATVASAQAAGAPAPTTTVNAAPVNAPAAPATVNAALPAAVAVNAVPTARSTTASAQSSGIVGMISAFFGLPGAPATSAPTISAGALNFRLTINDIFDGVPAPTIQDPTVVVTGAFREILRRDPAPTELRDYEWRLKFGGINAVVTGLYSSTAFRQQEVNNYYLEMLGRPATSSELGTKAGELVRGAAEERVIASIAGTAEFLSDSALRGGQYGTQPGAASFTDLLYRSLLGQSADPNAAATYIQQFQGGLAAGRVALGFLSSDPWRSVKVNQVYAVAGLAGTTPAPSPTPYVDNWGWKGGLSGISVEILTSPAAVAILNAGVSLPNMTAVGQLQEILLASYLKGPTVNGKETPPQFIDLVQKYLGVDANGQKCPGKTLCNTELLGLLRTAGTSRGIPNSSVDIRSINASVASLIPTQSEIDMEQSLKFPLKNVEENGVYPLDNYLAGGLILHPVGAILTANNGTYVLDGHHRWSSIYVINPYTQVAAIDVGYIPSPQDGLKEVQMAIIARDAQLNPQLVEGVNLLDPNLQESVFNRIVEQYIYAGPDPVRTLNVFANFLGTKTPLDNPANQPEKLQAAQEYLWGNVKRLQTYNEPDPDVTDRAYMPQPAGNQYPPYLNPLEAGGITYTLPVISYLG